MFSFIPKYMGVIAQVPPVTLSLFFPVSRTQCKERSWAHQSFLEVE